MQHTPPEIDRQYDVLVVGARCAGAATAMLLARSGLSVLAVDRAGYAADTTSTHALTRPSVMLLNRWGLLDQVKAVGTPTVIAVEYRYGDDSILIPIRPDGEVDGLYAPRRTVLDRLLVDAAVASGATVAHRTRLTSLVHDRDGRVVGAVVENDGDELTVRARLVVGADGARSTVARFVGASTLRRARASSTTVYGFVQGLPDDLFRNLLRRGEVVGVIPTNDGAANVWVTVGTDRFAREARPDLAGFYDRTIAHVDEGLATHVRAHRQGPLRSFPGLAGFVRQPFGPGWALVGDACYFKDPISAHGMTDALIGAELLARSVVELAGGRDERVALAEYSSQRSKLAEPMMPAVAHLASMTWSLDSARAAHKAASKAMRAEGEFLASLPAAPVLVGR